MDKKNKISTSTLLSQTIERFKNTHNLMYINYLPRWVILLIDMSIVCASALLTFYILDGMGIDYVHKKVLLSVIAIFLLVNISYFWIFRTYSGIVRHSSFVDAMRLLVSLFFTMVTLVVVNYISLFVSGQKMFMSTGLFINFIFSFCALFIYRIIVKQTFEIYFTEKRETDLIKALIYGTDANAISVANTLKSEKPTRFKVVGFIDKENQNASKRLLNLPILNLKKKISVLLRAVNADGLIIADGSLTKDQKLNIVDECLAYNYKVYSVPVISDWENSNEISKKVKDFQIQDLLERKPIVLDNRAIIDQLKGKVILISGAAGSIGSEIARQVINFNPNKVIILDQAETPLHHLQLEMEKLDTATKIRTVISDVSNKAALTEVFKKYKPDVVFHAAAYKHVPMMEENPAQAIFVNVLGTKNITDLSCEFNVESFVMVSTDKAVNPSNVMGASKRIAEKYVQALHYKLNVEQKKCNTKFITTRFGNVLGSNGSVVPLFNAQIAKGGPLTITHPEIIRYFMTIQEACQLILEAGAMGNGGEIYIFDMGKPVKIIDLAKKMIQLAGLTPEKEIKIEVIDLRPGEKLYEELLNVTSKTLPTHHEKIMIALEESDDFDVLEVAINELIATAQLYCNNDIVAKMKAIVPEFISMNSNFEMLDVKQ